MQQPPVHKDDHMYNHILTISECCLFILMHIANPSEACLSLIILFRDNSSWANRIYIPEQNKHCSGLLVKKQDSTKKDTQTGSYNSDNKTDLRLKCDHAFTDHAFTGFPG